MKIGDIVHLEKSHKYYSLTVRDLELFKDLPGVSSETPMLVVDIEKLSRDLEKTDIVSVLCGETVVDFVSEKLTTHSTSRK